MSVQHGRQTLITFRGSLSEFREFLARLTDLFNPLGEDPPIYDEWELEASIARHPAGKGLGCRACGAMPCEDHLGDALLDVFRPNGESGR